jgi:hypothetical protein
MLTRSSQVGEFYIMSPPQVQPQGSPMHTCDIMIYDEESDKHVRITWAEALAATLHKDVLAEYPDVEVSTGPGGGLKLAEWKDAALTWQAYNQQSDVTDPSKIEVKHTDSFADGTTTVTDYYSEKGTAKTLADYKDIRIVVARPFIEHLMHNVILTVSGRDTGATLFGPADMQLSANTQVKTIEGHYTGHFKAVVTKPQNVMVMRDVACAGYVAGGNTRWFAKGYDPKTKAEEFKSEYARDNIMDRLSFSDDANDRYGSMLAFPAHEGQFMSGQLDTVMSVTSRLLPWSVQGEAQNPHESFPGGDKMFKAYRSTLHLNQVHYGEDMKAAENQDFISQGSTNNATCFLGPHRKYDPFTRSFMSLTPGQGHFGPDAIPGDARWRRGESVSLKAARDSMTSLELAQHAQMAYAKGSN